MFQFCLAISSLNQLNQPDVWCAQSLVLSFLSERFPTVGKIRRVQPSGGPWHSTMMICFGQSKPVGFGGSYQLLPANYACGVVVVPCRCQQTWLAGKFLTRKRSSEKTIELKDLPSNHVWFREARSFPAIFIQFSFPLFQPLRSQRQRHLPSPWFTHTPILIRRVSSRETPHGTWNDFKIGCRHVVALPRNRNWDFYKGKVKMNHQN